MVELNRDKKFTNFDTWHCFQWPDCYPTGTQKLRVHKNYATFGCKINHENIGPTKNVSMAKLLRILSVSLSKGDR